MLYSLIPFAEMEKQDMACFNRTEDILRSFLSSFNPPSHQQHSLPSFHSLTFPSSSTSSSSSSSPAPTSPHSQSPVPFANPRAVSPPRIVSPIFSPIFSHSLPHSLPSLSHPLYSSPSLPHPRPTNPPVAPMSVSPPCNLHVPISVNTANLHSPTRFGNCPTSPVAFLPRASSPANFSSGPTSRTTSPTFFNKPRASSPTFVNGPIRTSSPADGYYTSNSINNNNNNFIHTMPLPPHLGHYNNASPLPLHSPQQHAPFEGSHSLSIPPLRPSPSPVHAFTPPHPFGDNKPSAFDNFSLRDNNNNNYNNFNNARPTTPNNNINSNNNNSNHVVPRLGSPFHAVPSFHSQPSTPEDNQFGNNSNSNENVSMLGIGMLGTSYTTSMDSDHSYDHNKIT